LLSRTLGGWIQESEVAGLLEATEKANPRCQIGSYPFFRDGKPGANFVIRSDDEAALEACAQELARELRALGKEVVEGGL
jgi:molybdopterin-biosynthesis enzyme MoeA-like protein